MDVDFSMGIACLKKSGRLVEKIAMYIADFLEQYINGLAFLI